MEKQPLSKAEAQAALNEINSVISNTQRAIATGPAVPLLIMWGLIWMVGYSASHFHPQHAGWVWMFLVTAGAISSWLLGIKTQPAVKSPHDLKIGLFWIVLFAYAFLWVFLLSPEGLPKGEEWIHRHPLDDKQIGAFMATVPMFAYVIGGLWFGRFFVILGLLVTALTIGGYIFFHPLFYLWMAITGGGSLVLSGLGMWEHTS